MSSIENSDSDNILIPIKNKWDSNPRLNLKKEENSHILRLDSSVVNEFLRRKNEGAILVTGKRGVGKTSLIYSCVNNLVKESRDKKILPIIINSTNFEIWYNYDDLLESVSTIKEIDKSATLNKSDNKSTNSTKKHDQIYIKKIVLQTLVRRLYKEIEKIHDVKDNIFKLTELYKKATASEVRQIIAFEEREEKIKNLKKEKVFEYKINLNILTLIASLGAATIVAINQSIDPILRLFISTLLATLPSLVLYYKSSKQEVDKKENTDSSKNNSRLQYDFDINTLEIEFEDVIRDLNNTYKIIFIIDELDKLPIRLVEDILKLFKTLFNNIDALFVFITDDHFYKTLVDKTKINRGIEYTLFLQKLFLQRPSFLEIRSFLDRIVDINRLSIDGANCLYKLFDLHNVTENSKQLNIDDEKFKAYLNNHKLTNIKSIVLNTFENPDKNLLEYKIKWGKNESPKFCEEEYSNFDLNISEVIEKRNQHEFIILKESNERIEKVSLFLKNRSYSDFQHYLCYLSQTDFFDLYSIIKDYSKFDINSLYLKIKCDDKLIIRANLQRIIEKFFLKKNILIPHIGIEMMFSLRKFISLSLILWKSMKK